MPRHPSTSPAASDTTLQRVFAGCFGALLGLSLLKFGNPALLDDQVSMPPDVYEWLLTAWPLAVGHGLIVLVIILGALVFRKCSGLSRWLWAAPLPWLVWQFIAAADSVDGALTKLTLVHFCTNIACFYLGLFSLSGIRDLRGFWIGLLSGYGMVLLSGWQQHFGGLAATRDYFFTEVYPQLNGEIPEMLLKRMSSDRIFATLFYPNTLAGVVLLLLPTSVGVLPKIFHSSSAQRIGLMLVIVMSAGCLFWSGSKAGWLIMIGLSLVALMRLRFSRALKMAIALTVLVAGLAGFALKYSGYLQKGAQSAVARMDYWTAAQKVTLANPITGTGPGTFGKSYAEIKRPESEMAQLTHNDYLQQASDSGAPGFLFFFGFILLMMVHIGRRVWNTPNGLHFCIWLGLLGISLQGLVEFGWYIPATAWPMMALLGWALGTVANPLDKSKPQNLSSATV